MAASSSAPKASRKHVLIDKANQIALIALSAAVAILIFSLFAAQALFKQNLYNQKVIGEKRKALKQIRTNRSNVDDLVNTYRSFASEPVNVLGGNPAGEGPKDGDNPRIVLDSLPSQYDFPGFASSMEKLIQTQGGLNIEALGGTDTGSGLTSSDVAATTPEPSSQSQMAVPLAMPISVRSDYAKIQQYLKSLESSIRPIYINSLKLNGSDNNLQLEVQMQTYYQPEKTVEIGSKVVN